MTITIPSGRTLPLQAKSGGGFRSSGLVAAPSGGFTPLLAENFLQGTNGQQATIGGSTWGARALYDQAQAFSGGQSMKLSMSSSDGQSCGGDHYYGGKSTLPTLVPKGNNIWYRVKLYIPSTFSWGYVYSGSGDDAAASACGQFADGFGRHKFLVFDPDNASGRMYLQLHGSRRSVDRVAGLTIDTDVGGFGFLDNSFLIPVDQWFDLQIQMFVDDVNGFYRVWADGVYKGQIDGPTIGDAAAQIRKVGIGDYWNGVHYTDGLAGRSDFWLDEMLVATDVAGYGAPTGTDAGGRPFIDPTTLVGDL